MAPPKQQSFISRALISLGLAKVKASLLVVGLANSGKTSIVNTLKADRTEDVAPTVGFAVEKFSVLKTKLTVMDMSGQQRYQPLWECYYQDVQGVIFVADAADKHSLATASDVLWGLLGNADLAASPLLIYANKMDLAHAVPASDIAVLMDLASITDRPWQIAPSSAATGEGVESGITWLLEQIRGKAKQRRSSRMAPDSAGSSFSSMLRARSARPGSDAG
ncbi:hypothetical protein WJX72_007347 [[Myrmecia] bisecta]|uniref:ADP-ribosylation factor-like protein 6 n=1 Tax=[Myrmecia] bisecta TaxID=41462 RepID=A0AAW1QFK2_9CHLO